jgi:hypothetical protein
MAAAAPPPLTVPAIHEAMDRACLATTEQCWTLRRARGSDFANTDAATLLLLFGIILASKDNNNSPSKTFRTTFYLAYSTWDGRVLYVDHLGSDDPAESLLVYRTLADLAVNLHCRRYVIVIRLLDQSCAEKTLHMLISQMLSHCV